MQFPGSQVKIAALLLLRTMCVCRFVLLKRLCARVMRIILKRAKDHQSFPGHSRCVYAHIHVCQSCVSAASMWLSSLRRYQDAADDGAAEEEEQEQLTEEEKAEKAEKEKQQQLERALRRTKVLSDAQQSFGEQNMDFLRV
jgi:hypothetical protein